MCCQIENNTIAWYCNMTLMDEAIFTLEGKYSVSIQCSTNVSSGCQICSWNYTVK